MIHRDFVIERGGSRPIRLVFPCFEDEAQPERACRMNRFYGAAADAAFRYAEELPDDRRFGYFCSYEAEEEDGCVLIRLHFSFRRAGKKTQQRTLIHRWKDGVLSAQKGSRTIRKMRCMDIL